MDEATPSECGSVSAAIGRGLQEWRAAGGELQEDLARAMRQLGAPWTQATVAAVERGRRNLTLDELVLLSSVTLEPLHTLIPDVAAVHLTDEVAVTSDELRHLFAGQEPRWASGWLGSHFDAFRSDLQVDVAHSTRLLELREKLRWVWTDAPLEAIDEADRSAGEEMIRRVAKRLNSKPATVALAALRSYGRGLVAERDARAAAHPLGETASLKATRGFVTTQLIDELERYIEMLADVAHDSAGAEGEGQ